MSQTRPLSPSYGRGVTVAPDVTSASTTLPAGTEQIVLTHISGTDIVYVRVTASDDTSAATTADYPIAPGYQVTITRFQDHTRVAYIASGAGSSLHIMPAQGW